MSKDKDARVVLEIPMRDAYKAEFTELKERLVQVGLKLMHSDLDIGSEDWAGAEGQEEVDVVAWWAVYGWEGSV